LIYNQISDSNRNRWFDFESADSFSDQQTTNQIRYFKTNYKYNIYNYINPRMKKI